MATSQAQFPRPVRAAPDPLGWYLRPSKAKLEARMREKRKMLEHLRAGLGRFVQEGRAVSLSLKPLRRAQRG